MIEKLCRNAVLLALLVMSAGCAATSTFTAYPHKVQPLVTSLTTRTPLDLSQCLLEECQSKDLILYNMERGRYAHIIGNSDVSMADFRASMAKIKENDEKALISASDIGANVAAALVNDNAIPYEGEGYERVLLHHYQALNYLRKKDLEGAGVEVRRANAEQEESLKRFEKELDKSREEAEEKKVSGDGVTKIDSQYAQMDEIAGRVKNSFQNAYTFYVSAFIYELLQQPNDAYIDYKKALEIYPENSCLQKDVLRLAKKLEMYDDLAALRERFANSTPLPEDNVAEAGELLVLFEDGFVPQKHQVKVALPIGKGNLVSIAFPIYQDKWAAQSPLSLLDGGASLGSTEAICDVRTLAVKALKEKVPVIATRQIIRAIAKGVAAAEAKKKMGELGQFATNLWNLVSENADLRSWLTLPANAQIMRVTVPAGSRQLTLRHPMVPAGATVAVNMSANGKAVLHVVRSGAQLYSSVTEF